MDQLYENSEVPCSLHPQSIESVYLPDNMLSYGKSFILDRTIPQKEGIPSSQVARLKSVHNRVIMSRHSE